MTPSRVLDTNIVSYRFDRHPLWRKYQPLVAGYKLYVPFVVVGELLFGAANAGWGDNRRRRLEHLLSTLDILPWDRQICDLWAEIRHARRHRPIDPQDAWVAAVAVGYGLELVTHDAADFEGVPDLTVITAA